ncbi:MAG: amino acid ABC transporter substrate-binding protein [Rhodobacteraceae bacterium]|nr:amino acid ABC transporter substrate-binding protein [Paracoccaceae bacterium]
MMSCRSLAVALCAAVLLCLPGAHALAQADLIVGVRSDAPPFAYLGPRRTEGRMTVDAPSGQGDMVFTGYMVNVCTGALEELRKRETFTVEYLAVDAPDRFEELRAGRIDILCDPATITRERLAGENVYVSPPVYLSGVGRAQVSERQWVAHWPCIGPVVGVVNGTTAPRAVKLMADEFGFGETFSDVVQRHPDVDRVVLSESEANDLTRCAAVAEKFGRDPETLAPYTNPDPALTDPSAAVAVRSYPNHRALARALCSGEIYYSVGDLEIVSRAIAAIRETEFRDCTARVDPQVFSEERYGIFVHVSDEMDRSDRLALAFLRQLSIEIHKGYDSILVRSFADNFDRARISQSLDIFLWSVVAGAE